MKIISKFSILALIFPTLLLAKNTDWQTDYHGKDISKFRISLGAAKASIDDVYLPNTVHKNGISVAIGGDINRYLSINASYSKFNNALTIYGESVDANVYTCDLEYGLPIFFSDSFNIKPYLDGGMARGTVKNIDSDSTFAYGGGIRTTIAQHYTIDVGAKFADFNYADTTMYTVSIGYSYW